MNKNLTQDQDFERVQPKYARYSVDSEDITPFPQEPDMEPAGKDGSGAARLFSLFTANVIRSKTLIAR